MNANSNQQLLSEVKIKEAQIVFAACQVDLKSRVQWTSDDDREERERETMVKTNK